MTIKRRKSVGKLLLSGVALGVAVGCTADKEEDTLVGEPNDTNVIVDSGLVGNLMAPPEHELCIDVTPDNASVTVDYALDGDGTVVDGGCEMVYDGMVEINASAEGYQDYNESIEVYENMTHSFTMEPVSNSGSGGSYGDGLRPEKGLGPELKATNDAKK